MRLLYVGDSWQGSNARSLREALTALPDVAIQEVDEDHFISQHRQLGLRIANRLLRPLQIRELGRSIVSLSKTFQPDALLVYKGWRVGPDVVRAVRRQGIVTVNIYPDRSPHVFGAAHREAVGLYDLVISTKPFHPSQWRSVYGYMNRCVCVPHGYDPTVHQWDEACSETTYDLVLCAMWREEYDRLMRVLACQLPSNVSVAVAGHGWTERSSRYPRHWKLFPPRLGRAYGEFVRSGRIVIAPVNREITVDGNRQPGDEDTARTYELAAAHCFFLHQQTDFVTSVYDERTEVPMWRDPAELVSLVSRWLPDERGRIEMAARAHARAVPDYSFPSRAKAVLDHVRGLLDRRG
jgi:hypothetical protein